MIGSARRRLGVAAALLLLAACSSSEPTLLVVDLRTDFVAGVEVDRVRTLIEHDGGGRPEVVETAVKSEDDWVEGQRIAELEGLPRGLVRLRVTLLEVDGDTETAVAERPVTVELSGRQRVGVVITRSCRDASCPPMGDAAATACRGTGCVDPRCTEQSPERCGDPECTTASECPSGAECAAPACVAGVCLLEADAAACADDEVCRPDSGCAPADCAPGEDCGADPIALRGMATGEAVDPEPGTPGGVSVVTTDTTVPALTDGLYIAAVSSTGNVDIDGVSGLGLEWDPVEEQCAASTRVELWSATGSPAAAGEVTASSADAESLVIGALAYEHTDIATPLGGSVSTTSGAECATEIYDEDAYAMSLPIDVEGAVALTALAVQDSAHMPRDGSTERLERHAAHPDFPAGLAVVDLADPPTGDLELTGSFDAGEDYAAAAVLIRPAP